MSISVICGPMFSGKSSAMLSEVKRHSLANKQVFLIKHSLDIRFGNLGISTHSGNSIPANISVPLLSQATDSVLNAEINIDVIAVDEGQFFPDLVRWCEMMANIGKKVIVAGLVTNFNRDPFPTMTSLICKAERYRIFLPPPFPPPFPSNTLLFSVTKLSAICMTCYKDASFHKLINNNVGPDPKDYIGGSEMYKAVCRVCYYL